MGFEKTAHYAYNCDPN